MWDIRNKKMIQRYRGHQNFVSNFVKASFGPEEKIIISGSEDGIMYIIIIIIVIYGILIMVI